MPPSETAPFPPDAETVIARALCLASLFLRGVIEQGIHSASDPDHYAAYPELAMRLSGFLNEQDFTAHFTLAELDDLSKEPGTWEPELLQSRPALAESLGVLLWALSLHAEIPGYDEPFDPPNLEPLLGWPGTALANPLDEKLASFPTVNVGWFKDAAKLRPQPAILGQRVAVECWRWRVQVDELMAGDVPPPEGMQYPVMIALAADDAHASGAVARPVADDFPLFGKAFGKLSGDERAEAAMIIAARGIALDWLCGYWTEWENVPTAMD